MNSSATAPVLSLAHLTMLDAHPLELVEAAAAGGFDAIGLRLAPPRPGDPLVPVVGDEQLVRDLQVRMGDLGVTLLDIEVFWLGESLDTEELKRVFDVAHRLGCRNVLAMGNDPEPDRIVDTFARFCQLAAGFDMGVGLEFMPYLATANLADAVRILRAAAQPRTGVVIDVLHLIRSGGTVAELAAVPAGEVLYAQLCDVRGPTPAELTDLRFEARNARWYPGEGDAPLAQILSVLPPGLPLAVEAPCLQYANLPVVERGRLCGDRTRQFLARHASHAAKL